MFLSAEFLKRQIGVACFFCTSLFKHMAKNERKNIDYPTLLGYINDLGIKVYNMSKINCAFRLDEIVGRGASMMVFRGYLADSDTLGPDTIPVALKVSLKIIKENAVDTKVSNVLNDVRQ